MDDPIKILFKFQNDNRRIQYHTYIYIGIVPPAIMNILGDITHLSLYDTFIKLSTSDYAKLDNHYGDKWYNKFFNTYHVHNTLYNIDENKQQKKELSTKYGDVWYKKHIGDHKLIEKKIYYSYATTIKEDKLRKEMRRIKIIPSDEDEVLDYTTMKPVDISEMDTDLKRSTRKNQRNEISMMNNETSDGLLSSDELSSVDDDILLYGGDNQDNETVDILHNIHNSFKLSENRLQTGGDGNDDEVEINDDEDYEVEDDPDEIVELEAPCEECEQENVELDAEIDEDTEMEDIERLYQDMDVERDVNLTKTSELIKEALKDDKIFKKTKSNLIEFDTSKDNLMYDEQLKNAFTKIYVTSQYIFKDDTIKMIKNKICCSILNNKKFSETPYIAPSRQYLWSEYYFTDKIEKVMIGQKWVKKTDLLHIDVEPNNNIRVYEELRGKLKLLRDNIKRYGSKIKREDDDFNILYDYEDYYTNNEIYMSDIYNHLGKGYAPDQEAMKNISDVFFRVYYPRIKQDDIKYIIDYLGGDVKIEENKIFTIHETLNNDILMENQIIYTVEELKKVPVYRSIFKQNYITQSVIHVNLRIAKNTKIDLYSIFNEFVPTLEYPFIQYQTIDGQIVFKYSEKYIAEYSNKKENIDVLSKWFENAPYGISFKVRITEKNTEKFMAINLNDNSRIEYKTQWKEEDMATVDDIKNTYNYVKHLIGKINSEKNKIKFDIPENEEFKYAFINTIQKFELPEKFSINHNDLSEFSRYFYPYIALVIEPRKRQSKIKKQDEKSKFGTYLRYKRVSKYENQARIEQRILYFMRNYDYNDQSLANEISKQFNITMDRAMEEIERVREKYPNIKRSRKTLKRLENIPKYKPPGIGIDIQGKQRDKYKIRISGARNKDQLDRIITFMNILIYLYTETYLYKKPERQKLKEKLKKLINIAKRRNKVDEIVDYEKSTTSVKNMAKLDKKRLGFKPEKGQNQWTRLCQHSGTDKKRRPQQYISIDEVIKNGFTLNDETGIYEKKVSYKSKKGKNKEIVIRAVGLKGVNDVNDPTIFYSCNPIENGEHMHVGFLSRSKNPFGSCMPCCFRKDPYLSRNVEKRDYFMNCIGQTDKKKDDLPKIVGDRLYILQDTNKIQEGRLAFLPRYLDFYLNENMGKTRKIKHHYLLNTKTGYYFKYGSKQDEFPFLNAIASVYDTSVEKIKEKFIKCLEDDKQDQLFTAINNGDTKTQFQTKEHFITFMKTNTILPFDIFAHFMSIPGVITKQGINILIFRKHSIVIKKTLEKEKTIDDFTLVCQNTENIDDLYNKDTILLIKENKNYFPIVFVTKIDEITKDIDIRKIFKYSKEKDNVINYVTDFYLRNCENSMLLSVTTKLNNIVAKKAYNILMEIGKKDYTPKYQIIDARNKCKYLMCNNGTIVPVALSGSIYNLAITKHIQDKLKNVEETIVKLNDMYSVSKQKLPVKPIGLYYETKTKTKATVIAIMTMSYDVVPVNEEIVDIAWAYKQGYVLEHKQLYDKIDEEIRLSHEKKLQIDDRIKNVNNNKYMDESYELFRLELSEYLNLIANEGVKKKIIKILISNSDKKAKKHNIKLILYQLVDKTLFDKYNSMEQPMTGGKYDKFVQIINTQPVLDNYIVKNNRNVCAINTTKDTCIKDDHCKWFYDKCYFTLTRDMAIIFINKVSEELTNDDLKAAEILRKDEYFVSDVVDYNVYTEREGQKIIKSTNYILEKKLTDLFGKENIPTIGKRRVARISEADYFQINANHPLRTMDNYYLQEIIDNNLSIYRAFANGYFWFKQQFYDLDSRNLGYYSSLQTNLSNYFKSIVVDYLIDKNNKQTIEDEIFTYVDLGTKKKDKIFEFVRRISKDIVTNTNCVTELYVLNKVYSIPIYVYNNNNDVIYLIDDGLKFDGNKQKLGDFNKDEYSKYRDIKFMKKSVNIKYLTVNNMGMPINIEVIYYS